MKRFGNLYNKIYHIENLKLADKKARKGKIRGGGNLEIYSFDLRREEKLLKLQQTLIDKKYKTSSYTSFKVKDPKERVIHKLPYYPDRILHHAIMGILEPIFVSSFTNDTYSCIKGKGIHNAYFNVKKALNDKNNTKYCLKLDIKKFYPSINHDILKKLLRKKFKDKDLLFLLDEIIESTDGVPLGNYLSQYFANFYLTYFDHWIKEELKVKYYFRYCDDIVIFGDSKDDLRIVFNLIEKYLRDNLRLTVKSNYQIFPVNSRGVDFIGYKFYHTHILLRKRIKNNFIKMIKIDNNEKSINSYKGWLKWCNSINLQNKYLYDK